MLHYLLAALVLAHGAIHFTGFARTMKSDNSTGAVEPVPGGQGWLWFITAILFLLAAVLLLKDANGWWVIALAGLALSQWLIVLNWKDTKWATIVNLLILIAVIYAFIHRQS